MNKLFEQKVCLFLNIADITSKSNLNSPFNISDVTPEQYEVKFQDAINNLLELENLKLKILDAQLKNQSFLVKVEGTTDQKQALTNLEEQVKVSQQEIKMLRDTKVISVDHDEKWPQIYPNFYHFVSKCAKERERLNSKLLGIDTEFGDIIKRYRNKKIAETKEKIQEKEQHNAELKKELDSLYKQVDNYIELKEPSKATPLLKRSTEIIGVIKLNEAEIKRYIAELKLRLDKLEQYLKTEPQIKKELASDPKLALEFIKQDQEIQALLKNESEPISQKYEQKAMTLKKKVRDIEVQTERLGQENLSVENQKLREKLLLGNREIAELQIRSKGYDYALNYQPSTDLKKNDFDASISPEINQLSQIDIYIEGPSDKIPSLNKMLEPKGILDGLVESQNTTHFAAKDLISEQNHLKQLIQNTEKKAIELRQAIEPKKGFVQQEIQRLETKESVQPFIKQGDERQSKHFPQEAKQLIQLKFANFQQEQKKLKEAQTAKAQLLAGIQKSRGQFLEEIQKNVPLRMKTMTHQLNDPQELSKGQAGIGLPDVLNSLKNALDKVTDYLSRPSHELPNLAQMQKDGLMDVFVQYPTNIVTIDRYDESQKLQQLSEQLNRERPVLEQLINEQEKDVQLRIQNKQQALGELQSHLEKAHDEQNQLVDMLDGLSDPQFYKREQKKAYKITRLSEKNSSKESNVRTNDATSKLKELEKETDTVQKELASAQSAIAMHKKIASQEYVNLLKKQQALSIGSLKVEQALSPLHFTDNKKQQLKQLLNEQQPLEQQISQHPTEKIIAKMVEVRSQLKKQQEAFIQQTDSYANKTNALYSKQLVSANEKVKNARAIYENVLGETQTPNRKLLELQDSLKQAEQILGSKEPVQQFEKTLKTATVKLQHEPKLVDEYLANVEKAVLPMDYQLDELDSRAKGVLRASHINIPELTDQLNNLYKQKQDLADQRFQNAQLELNLKELQSPGEDQSLKKLLEELRKAVDKCGDLLRTQLTAEQIEQQVTNQIEEVQRNPERYFSKVKDIQGELETGQKELSVLKNNYGKMSQSLDAKQEELHASLIQQVSHAKQKSFSADNVKDSSKKAKKTVRFSEQDLIELENLKNRPIPNTTRQVDSSVASDKTLEMAADLKKMASQVEQNALLLKKADQFEREILGDQIQALLKKDQALSKAIINEKKGLKIGLTSEEKKFKKKQGLTPGIREGSLEDLNKGIFNLNQTIARKESELEQLQSQEKEKKPGVRWLRWLRYPLLLAPMAVLPYFPVLLGGLMPTVLAGTLLGPMIWGTCAAAALAYFVPKIIQFSVGKYQKNKKINLLKEQIVKGLTRDEWEKDQAAKLEKIGPKRNFLRKHWKALSAFIIGACVIGALGSFAAPFLVFHSLAAVQITAGTLWPMFYMGTSVAIGAGAGIGVGIVDKTLLKRGINHFEKQQGNFQDLYYLAEKQVQNTPALKEKRQVNLQTKEAQVTPQNQQVKDRSTPFEALRNQSLKKSDSVRELRRPEHVQKEQERRNSI